MNSPVCPEATRRVLEATGVGFYWDVQEAGADVMESYGGNPLPGHVLESIERTGIALKGPITTPVGGGFRSVNVTLRKTLDLEPNFTAAHYYLGQCHLMRGNRDEAMAEFEIGRAHV